jgi:hypothetical protein
MRKPKETTKVAPQTMEQILVKSPDFKSYYINNVRIGITSNDFNLLCGLINSPDQAGHPAIVEDQLSIRLSPQTLRVVANALTSALDGWEKIFGKLPDLPSGILNTKGIEASLDSMQERIRALSDET